MGYVNIMIHCLVELSINCPLTEEIVREFRFFPRLHCMYAARPNIVPIAITTGVGPSGPRTQWIQRPDTPSDNVIDPALLEDNLNDLNIPDSLPSSSPPPSSQQSRAFGTDHTNTVPPSTPAPSLRNDGENTLSRPPKPSSASCQKLDGIKATISMVPKKRTLTDAVIEMSK